MWGLMGTIHITVNNKPVQEFVRKEEIKEVKLHCSSNIMEKRKTIYKPGITNTSWQYKDEEMSGPVSIVAQEEYMWNTLKPEYDSVEEAIFDVLRRAPGRISFGQLSQVVRVVPKYGGDARTYSVRWFQKIAQRIEKYFPQYLKIVKEGRLFVLYPKTPVKAKRLDVLMDEYGAHLAAVSRDVRDGVSPSVSSEEPAGVEDGIEGVVEQRVRLVLDLEINISVRSVGV